jgi:hypothetical protein
MRSIIVLLASLVAACVLLGSVQSQDKKAAKKDTPRVVVVAPLGVPVGAKTKVTIWGVKLDDATEVRFFEPKVMAKLVKAEKVPVPNQQDPNRIGDSRLQVELTVPDDIAMSELSFLVVTKAGESAPHKLLVNGEPAPIVEKEPNNGFRQAQSIPVPAVIDGAINSPQDVDVFKIDGTKGQRLVCQVLAARYGSPVDSILTLYHADGKILAINDDHDGSPDSRLEVTLPRNGTYYLGLVDAHDMGGPQYVYRLVVELAK